MYKKETMTTQKKRRKKEGCRQGGAVKGVHTEEEACEREGIGHNRPPGTRTPRTEDTGMGMNVKGKLHWREDPGKKEAQQ